jgi:hypothetical protein
MIVVQYTFLGLERGEEINAQYLALPSRAGVEEQKNSYFAV